ncbi:MAG: choice-of-anchor D domain-containing protein, partial [Terriglobales bacterium]
MTTTPRAMISAVVGLSLTTLLLVAAGSGQQPAPQQTIDLVAGGDVQNVPASSIGLFDPLALALDAQGNLVISDCTRIYKVNLASGILTTIAGNGGACGTKLYGDPGNGGPAVAASVNGATGLAVDSAGDVIFTDQGSNEVREINASTGVVTAIAGTGVAGYSGDGGPATQAELNQPVGLAMDASGNLYFADDAGSGYIRKITQATGIISTVAAVPHPLALALDGVGHLYVSSQTGTLSQITLTSGLVAVIAGGGATPPATGVAAASANFGFMRGGVYADATGNVYFGGAYLGSTYSVSALWKIDAGSTVLTLMAGGGSSFSPTGPAAASRFDTLQGIAPDASGDLILASNSYVLKLDPSGNLSPLAGDGVAAQESSGNNLPELSSMITPAGVDGTGYGFAADAGGNRILAFGKGTETVFAGTGQPGYTGDGGPAVNAQLSYPQDVMTNSNGEMFIADSGNGVVRAVDQSTGIISTYAQGLAFPEGIALDAQGDLYIADTGNNEVKRVDAITHVVAIVAGDGTRDPTGTTGDGGLATNAELHFPQAVAVDNSGNLYITDHNLGYGYQGNPIADGTVRRVDAQTGIITTVAGVGDPGGNPPSTAVGSGDGGPATEAGLSDPDGIAVDANGNLYIADLGAAKVREVLASTGDIYTLAGNGQGGASGDGGPAVQAEFRPCGIRLDAGGNLWITDCDAGRLWELNNAVGAPVVSGRTDFPPQLAGTSSTPVAVTITNPGLAPITISGISPATGSSPDFTETNNCGTLTTGQTCTVNVTFTPSQLGFESGSFSINNNVSVAQVQAYGLGGSPAAPTVGTTSLTFATQAAGTTSAGQTVVLTDSGSNALPLTGISIQASGAFAETNNCGTTMPGGTNCSIVVTFAPAAAGGSTGTLTITDTASGLTETVSLAGTGTAATATAALYPAALQFT